MKAFTSTFLVLAACAAHSNPGTHGGGSGSGSDEEGVDAGMGSGSDVSPPPPPGALYGTVLDERGDTIDFSTGEPVHTHAGPAIDLANSGGDNGCPAVYKYAYLEDASDPMFGRQTTTNPLAWHVTAPVGIPLDASATAYRVRALDGTVLLDWTPAAPDETGLYTIELHRNGSPAMPALGDHTGVMDVDIRFRDTSGNEMVDTACWENHPLAAPLEVTPAVQSTLFAWTLPANSPISIALNPPVMTAGTEPGAQFTYQYFVQHTAEPVTIQVMSPAITGKTTNTSVAMYAADGTTAVDIDCKANPTECVTEPHPPVATTVDGLLVAMWSMSVFDLTSLTYICQTGFGNLDACVIPARAATEAPHKYALMISMSAATSIAPPMGSGPYGEFALSTLRYTGSPPDAYGYTACTTRSGTTCVGRTFFVHIVALDKARIDFDSVKLAVQTQPDSTAELETIGAYAAPNLVLPAQSWDAGDKGLVP